MTNKDDHGAEGEIPSSSSTEGHEDSDYLGRNAHSDVEKKVFHESLPTLVDWDGPEDPQNPMNWTSLRKWITIVLVSAVTFNVWVTSQTVYCRNLTVDLVGPWRLQYLHLVYQQQWNTFTRPIQRSPRY